MSDEVAAVVRRMSDLAWAAGVLDHSGHFMVGPRKDKPGLLRVWITFRPNGLRRAVLSEELARILGGKVHSMGQGAPNRNVWTASGAKGCAQVTTLVLPYMRGRARRAQLHLDLCERIRDYKPASFEERTLPLEEVEERERMRWAINGL